MTPEQSAGREIIRQATAIRAQSKQVAIYIAGRNNPIQVGQISEDGPFAKITYGPEVFAFRLDTLIGYLADQ